MEKKYYWLKLKNDFFSDKRIKKLRKIAGGDTYTIIYLKMMLKALDNDGVIEYEGVEDSFAEELALDLDEETDNVQVTLNFLFQSGLLVEVDGNNYELPMVKESIGCETSSAKRVREFRERQKALQCNADVTPMKQSVNGEIEIEIDIDKEKDNKKKNEPKHKFGVFKHVRLTMDEYKRLTEDYGQDATNKAIDFFDAYIEEKGYKSKSHNMAMRRWVFDAVKEQEQKRAKINGKASNKFNNFQQNQYTPEEFSELEKQLLDN